MTWVDELWPHFLVISAIVYLIILLTVSIGIAIPAWNICRKKPVEALREE
jgi:ABC-type antimicrobial peptide transport system permease subunit